MAHSVGGASAVYDAVHNGIEAHTIAGRKQSQRPAFDQKPKGVARGNESDVDDARSAAAIPGHSPATCTGRCSPRLASVAATAATARAAAATVCAAAATACAAATTGRAMPNTSRQDDKDRSARAQEQEFKRARGAISCAECRRLKLKCDKTVPCSSCKRRGCSSICPNGSLTTGQGTRFILADTDRLHRKIAEMSDRIRQLEDALAILQSSVTRDLHPLLAHDLLKIKSGLELHSAAHLQGRAAHSDDAGEQGDEESQYIDAFGTLAVRDDGAAMFYGRSAGSESLLLDENEKSGQPPPAAPHASLPHALARLTTAFPAAPSGLADADADMDVQELMEAHLPPWPRAAQLCDLYLEQAPWFFGAVTRRQLVEEVLPLFYAEAVEYRAHAGASGSGSIEAGAQVSSSAAAFDLQPARTPGTAHDLALLFVTFCFGALTDVELPPAPHNSEAEQYFQLTRAALNAEPLLERPPSVVTVQTMACAW
ncbi:predicted protein [Postia placenta Mad-698-R]|nr:predicted protein [Postia placenta Mad-698-R]